MKYAPILLRENFERLTISSVFYTICEVDSSELDVFIPYLHSILEGITRDDTIRNLMILARKKWPERVTAQYFIDEKHWSYERVWGTENWERS